MRDTHHRLAKLLADPRFDTAQILKITGYSSSRLLQLRGDPAFQQLVVLYKDKVDEAWVRSLDEFYETSTSNMLRAERMIEEHLDEADETGDKVSLKTLMALTADRADRFGYSKKVVQRNENLDFAAMMEQIARASGRSNVIDAKAIPTSRPATSGDEGGRDE